MGVPNALWHEHNFCFPSHRNIKFFAPFSENGITEPRDQCALSLTSRSLLKSFTSMLSRKMWYRTEIRRRAVNHIRKLNADPLQQRKSLMELRFLYSHKFDSSFFTNGSYTHCYISRNLAIFGVWHV